MDNLTRSVLMSAAGSATGSATEVEFVGYSSRRVITTDTEAVLTLSGLQADDVVFAVYTSDSQPTSSLTSNSTDLSNDWNGPYEQQSSPKHAFWWRVATGTSVTVDFNTFASQDRYAYSFVFYAFRNLDTTTPYVLIGTESANSSSIDITDLSNGPSYATYAVAHGNLHDDINVTITPPSGYTTIETIDTSQSNGNNSTLSVAYSFLAAYGSKTGLSFTANSTDTFKSAHLFLVPAGEDGTPPVITGSSTVAAATGGTAVATYSADDSVTWSLEGTDASLFSISSGGVLTANSTSLLGSYSIDVRAVNPDNLSSTISVNVLFYSTAGGTGGGITRVAETSGTTNGNALTLSLTGLQSGDVVFYAYVSDRLNNLSDTGGLLATQYTAIQEDVNGASPYMKLMYKVTSSTSESLSFASNSGGNISAVGMFAYRGVNNTDPILSESSITTGNSAAVDCPSHYIIANSVEVLMAGWDDDGGTSATPPSGYTEFIEQNALATASTSNGALLHFSDKNVTGNTTEPARTVTCTSNDHHFALSFTLYPD